MRYTPVLNILGILLAILAATMLLPMIADIVTGSSNWQAFAISALITGFMGVGLWLAHNNQADFDIGLRQAFLLTNGAWMLLVSVWRIALFII